MEKFQIGATFQGRLTQEGRWAEGEAASTGLICGKLTV